MIPAGLDGKGQWSGVREGTVVGGRESGVGKG